MAPLLSRLSNVGGGNGGLWNNDPFRGAGGSGGSGFLVIRYLV